MNNPPREILPRGPGSLLLLRLRSIGDAVLTLPLAEAMKRARPDLHLSILLEPLPATLLRGQPPFDQVIEIGRGIGARLRTLRSLRQRRFDVALDLHGGSTAAMLTAFSGARERVGLETYRHPWAYDLRLPVDANPPLHTVRANLALARHLGLPAAGDLVPRLKLDPAAEIDATTALAAAGILPGVPFVVVHPWAAMASKTWPMARFRELARRLRAYGHQVVLPVLTRDSERFDDAAGVGPLALPALAALFARARLVVGNDSGPAHIAAAVGTPVIAIFGSQDPRIWRPLPDGVAVWKALPCSPCAGYSCANPRPLECLDTITVDEVEAAAVSRLG